MIAARMAAAIEIASMTDPICRKSARGNSTDVLYIQRYALALVVA